MKACPILGSSTHRLFITSIHPHVQPFIRGSGGSERALPQSVALLRDRTGRPGRAGHHQLQRFASELDVVKLELHAAETRAAHYFIEQSNGTCIRIPFDVVQVVRSEEEENTKTEESGLRGESE